MGQNTNRLNKFTRASPELATSVAFHLITYEGVQHKIVKPQQYFFFFFLMIRHPPRPPLFPNPPLSRPRAGAPPRAARPPGAAPLLPADALRHAGGVFLAPLVRRHRRQGGRGGDGFRGPIHVATA